MTYDELRAKIQHYNWVEANDLIQALDAVVELHKPFMGNTLELCKECSQLRKVDDPVITYPCPTIQVIEKELA
jgi:hypothetical protein